MRYKIGDYVMSKDKYSSANSEYGKPFGTFDYLYGVITEIDYDGSSINKVILTGTTLMVSFYNSGIKIYPDGKMRERNDKVKKLGV